MREIQQQPVRLEEAFDRIEETILPCIAMMLETLMDASANLAELEELTRAVERSSPAHVDAGEYRVASA